MNIKKSIVMLGAAIAAIGLSACEATAGGYGPCRAQTAPYRGNNTAGAVIAGVAGAAVYNAATQPRYSCGGRNNIAGTRIAGAAGAAIYQGLTQPYYNNQGCYPNNGPYSYGYGGLNSRGQWVPYPGGYDRMGYNPYQRGGLNWRGQQVPYPGGYDRMGYGRPCR